MLHNAGYYHAAYVAAVVIYGGYALTIWRRRRRVRERWADRARSAGERR